MTLRLYARRKKIPLTGVTVAVKHSKQHALDCKNCDSEVSTVDHFERIITLRGELTKDQVDSLLAIADKCPVHRTLGSRSEITTQLDHQER